MWPPQSVNTWPTPAPVSVAATSSPPVIQSEGAPPSEPPRLSSRQPPRFTDSPRLRLRLALRPRDGPAARTTRSTDSLRGARRRASAAAARLARPDPQTRLAARVAEPPRPPLGSHDQIHRLASAGGAPAPRRPAARTAAHQNFSHLTDLRSRPLATRTSRTRWII